MTDSRGVYLKDFCGDGGEGGSVMGSGFEDEDALVGGFYPNAAKVLEVRRVRAV